jgi:hypothetical protein
MHVTWIRGSSGIKTAEDAEYAEVLQIRSCMPVKGDCPTFAEGLKNVLSKPVLPKSFRTSAFFASSAVLVWAEESCAVLV